MISEPINRDDLIKFLTTPPSQVDDLPRAFSMALTSNSAQTMFELLSFTDNQLLTMRNIGIQKLVEFKDYLAKKGLTTGITAEFYNRYLDDFTFIRTSGEMAGWRTSKKYNGLGNGIETISASDYADKVKEFVDNNLQFPEQLNQTMAATQKLSSDLRFLITHLPEDQRKQLKPKFTAAVLDEVALNPATKVHIDALVKILQLSL